MLHRALSTPATGFQQTRLAAGHQIPNPGREIGPWRLGLGISSGLKKPFDHFIQKPPTQVGGLNPIGNRSALVREFR